jgi:hypothetical protein
VRMPVALNALLKVASIDSVHTRVHRLKRSKTERGQSLDAFAKCARRLGLSANPASASLAHDSATSANSLRSASVGPEPAGSSARRRSMFQWKSVPGGNSGLAAATEGAGCGCTDWGDDAAHAQIPTAQVACHR